MTQPSCEAPEQPTSRRSGRLMFRLARLFPAVLVLAGLCAASSAEAASASDPRRFLDVEEWDATFSVQSDQAYSRSNERFHLHLRSDTAGKLTLKGGHRDVAAWEGFASRNQGSVDILEQQPRRTHTVKGSGASDPRFPAPGAITVDFKKGIYDVFAFHQTWIDCDHVWTNDGVTTRDRQLMISTILVHALSQPLPKTGMEISGSVTEPARHFSDNFDAVRITLSWRLTPKISKPDLEIEQVRTPAFEDGKHTFISPDNIAVSARVSGVRATDQASVLWTVTGKEGAAVSGFPRNWTTPVVGGRAEFSFIPGTNPTFLKDRMKRWTTGSRSPNPPLAFEVTGRLVVNGVEKDSDKVAPTELRQDIKDILRQEYVDFKLIAPKVKVPPRDEVGPPEGTGSFAGEEFNGGNYQSPAVVRNGAMQQLAQGTQAGTDVPLRINSAFRNPRRNKAVKGVPSSRHMFGDAVDLEPIGEAGMSKVERRRAYVDLYRAALGAGADRVLLELGPKALMKSNTPVPEPGPGQKDKDGDGIPDRLKVKVKGKKQLVWKLFDKASHVHLEKGP